MGKVTKNIRSYPQGEKPNYIIPKEYGPFRYAIGRIGDDPLVAICMNPSAAKEDFSDATINRIINVSKRLNKDGWMVFNLYPERATKASDMGTYDKDIADINLDIIKDFLVKNEIDEVWGAWGNSGNISTLVEAKKAVIALLKEINVRVYYFGTLTNEGNPRHPLQRNEKLVLDNSNKKYL